MEVVFLLDKEYYMILFVNVRWSPFGEKDYIIPNDLQPEEVVVFGEG